MAKRLSIVDTERCVGCQSCMFACARRPGIGGLDGTAIWVKSAGGIRKGFTVVVCRACPDAPCAKVCPTDALIARDGGGVKLRPELCIACGNCVKTCPFGAISWNEQINKPVVCVYCGYCVSYCPLDVLALEEIDRPIVTDTKKTADGGQEHA